MYLVATVLSSILGACSAQNDVDSGSRLSAETSTENGNEIHGAAPEYLKPFEYDSMKQLIKSIQTDFSDKILNDIEEKMAGNYKKGTFSNFIKEVKEEYLYVPYYKGKEIQLRNKEGFNNISLFINDFYDKPWIYYHTDEKQTGGIARIDIMYLDKNIKMEARQKSGSWLRTQLDSSYPNVDNYKNFENYSKIYDSEMKFNGRSVNTLVVQYSYDPRDNTYFVYDDILIKVVSKPGSTPNDWANDLSFEKISLK